MNIPFSKLKHRYFNSNMKFCNMLSVRILSFLTRWKSLRFILIILILLEIYLLKKWLPASDYEKTKRFDYILQTPNICPNDTVRFILRHNYTFVEDIK